MPPQPHASWGAACARCAAAKARCVRSEEGGGQGCRRCEGMGKECLGREKRERKKRVGGVSKTARLEEKLNNLVSLLQANPTETPPVLKATAPLPKQVASEPNPLIITTTLRALQPDSAPTPPAQLPDSQITVPPGSCICRAPVSAEHLRPIDTDDNLLSIYTTQLSPWFPFVIIPSTTTASTLAKEKPFLMSVIRMVSSFRSLRSMWAQRQAIMRHISDAVLIRAERSLELLQAIVVLLGFFHYHCLVHAQFNSLVALAGAMVGDLGLGKAPGLKERTRVLVERTEEVRERTGDERRVLVGVWYMSSNAAYTFDKTEPTRYTKYNDQCLAELEQAAEYETDALLVQIVRFQHLTQQMCLFNSRQKDVELPGIPVTPASVYHDAFRTQFQQLKDAIPPHLKSNYLLQSHINIAALRLYEPTIKSSSSNPSNPSDFPSASPETFTQTNDAIKSYFEAWLALPVCSYFSMSQPPLAHAMYGIRMLTRWATSPHPTPHPEDVHGRETTKPDTGAILDTIATRFLAAKQEMAVAHGGLWKNDMWDLAARKLRVKREMLGKWSEIVSLEGGEAMFLSRYRPAAALVPTPNLHSSMGLEIEGGAEMEGGEQRGFGGMGVDAGMGMGMAGVEFDNWLLGEWSNDVFGGIEGGWDGLGV